MASITPHYRSVKDLLQSRSFAIDEYQREYKWDAKNIDELLNDLLAKFQAEYVEGHVPRNAASYATYFLGSIIVTRRGEKGYLVDGQQRVTSLTLLLIHLYRESVARGFGVASTLEPLVYSNDFGVLKFNLDIEERLPALEALFNGTEFNPDGKPESVQTIVARYENIREFGLGEILGDGLEVFIYWLINNVGLIEISTDSDEHAYAIFETMNDRGKPLSPVDMLKAYLLGGIDDSERRATANRAWKRTVLDILALGDGEGDGVVLKAWLRAQYAESTRERKAGAVDRDWELIGSAFHRWVRDNARRIGVGTDAANFRLMTEDWSFFARAFTIIDDASENYRPGLEPVFYNAHNDFTWQPTLLLAALSPSDDEATVREKIRLVATYLDIWIMRRVVNYIRVGYSNVSYAMFLLANDIRRKPVDELRETLRRRLDEDDVQFTGTASGHRSGVTRLDLNQFSKRYIFHFLARVTAYVETLSGRADQFANYVDRAQRNSFDIEHITANDFARFGDGFASPADFEEWRNNIGGLLLLPADVNRSYQDVSFEEKAPHYAKQNLLAASLTPSAYEFQPQFTQFVERSGLPMRAYATFGREEQSERGELMLALAQEVWSADRLDA